MLLKENITDIKKVCRLCLYNVLETETVLIYNNIDLINKIKDCVDIEIEPTNTKLPSLICLNCMQQINQWATFRDICQQSHNILLESLAKLNNSTKIESCEINELNHDEFSDPNCASETDDLKVVEVKQVITTKIRKSTRICLKNKRKPKKRKLKLAIQKEEHSSASDIEIDDDSVAALEKYLRKLYKDDAEQDIKNEIAQSFGYDCDICRSMFSSIIEYLDHQESHNGQPVFRCQKCDQVFNSRSDLVDHDNRHQIPCPKCGKMVLPACLKNHMVLHTDRYICTQCNWRFCNSTMLRQHIESVHIRLKTHVCETCGKSFTSTTSLQTHIKIHSDARPYVCKICDYSGRTASALYTHMARHENGLHACELCAKSFKSFRSLRDHTRRVHSEKKNHECGFCQKKFVDKYMLTVHIRTHTGARPYQCQVCDRAFVRSDGLREHLTTHGQRASYSCTQCGKKFIYRRSLGRHTCTSANG